MTNYDNLTNDQLIKIIKDLQRQQKYGLIFEKQEENIIKKCKTHIPILKSVSGRNVNSGGVNHLLIEGDNYVSLLALMPAYKSKINVIYIDPPYNTGNKDFVYNDKFIDKENSFRHSLWLSFMEPRLELARELLSEDGVIFISIDDNEQAQLKLLCDEIFGESNFVSCLSWNKKRGGGKTMHGVADWHEYIIMYVKNHSIMPKFFSERKAGTSAYNLKDENGKYKLREFEKAGNAEQDRPLCKYPLKAPDGTKVLPQKQWWRWGKKTFEQKSNLIIWKQVKKNWKPYTKEYFTVDITTPSIIEGFFNKNATQEIKDLLGETISFSGPKPVGLLKYLTNMTRNKNSIILDFFAGSGTTGQAVLELNKEDGGKRKFILITNNENQICEKITYERCKKVINGYTTSKGKVIPPTGGNLHYFKTDFIKANQDPAQMRANLKEHIIPLVCIANDTYNNIKTTKGYEVYSNDNLTVAILTRNAPRYVNSLKNTIKNTKTPIKVYQALSMGGTEADLQQQLKKKVEIYSSVDDYVKLYQHLTYKLRLEKDNDQ